jgi:hypothetical protein
MRQIGLLVLCCSFPLTMPSAIAQPVESVFKNPASEEQAVNEKETLRAFKPPAEAEVLKARSLIMGLLVGTFVAVIIMFILIAYFYEPSEASKPYTPTSVRRPEGFTPLKPKQEKQRDRIVIDDE